MRTAASSEFGAPSRKATRMATAGLDIVVVVLLVVLAVGRYAAAGGTSAPQRVPVEVGTRYVAPQDSGVVNERLRMTATRWLRPAICAAPLVACLYFAAPPGDASRADSYDTVVCHTPHALAVTDSGDVRAMQDGETLGTKVDADEKFNAYSPFQGWNCELIGPFTLHRSA